MKSKIYFFLKNYLGFSARESRGFVLLVPVIFFLYLIPMIYNEVLKKSQVDKYQEYMMRIDSLESAGMTPFAGEISLSNNIYQDTTKRKTDYQRPNSPNLTKIPFSEADSTVLQVVPGIGEVLAGRIIKFRENMGGLHRKDQLLEVYGLQPEVMDRVFEYFEFVPGIRNKIRINQADANELAKHPYINYGVAKVLVAFRDQHGAYQKVEDLLKIKILNDEWLERLKPYLEF